MASSPFSMFSPFAQTIGRFVNEPITNWQRFFNPQVVFNYNPDDQGVEYHVLEKVGSYGSQISTLIDTIQALRTRIEEGAYSEGAAKALKDFDALRQAADKAVNEYRGRISAEDIVEAVRTLKARDPASADELKTRLAPILETSAKAG